MKRIFVTGNAGSGKSTLAAHVAEITGIPCYGLDQVVWRPGWTKAPLDERDRQMRELTEKDCWVIDGVSSAALAAADTVVFLDVPRRISFWRVTKRNWRYLFHSRPGLPPNCPEILIIPTLCRIIWNFPARIRPGILDQMEKLSASQRQFHLKSDADRSAFLAAIRSEGSSER
ncbi:MAG: hypothetical protein V4584_16490 [Verrucomicrobiota bacterium]